MFPHSVCASSRFTVHRVEPGESAPKVAVPHHIALQSATNHDPGNSFEMTQRCHSWCDVCNIKGTMPSVPFMRKLGICTKASTLPSSHMALCTLCATIPFDHLPPFPRPPYWHRVAGHDDMPELLYGTMLDDINTDLPQDPLGFPYHKDFSSLAESAATCPLCSIVQVGILRWKELHDHAVQTKPIFAENHMEQSPVPDHEMLWLTRRRFDSAGFVVLAWNPKRGRIKRTGVYLLTGVSLSVKAGGSYSPSIAADSEVG
ncbi:uncharacterized protein BKA78DRAFT_174735 [Phyllosticta capitalensis]|uniref:uncharacterized protein n=1 Tax=Phyllosticta capitalensis TaxID=121624 RepID=UPI00312ECAB6